MTGLGLSISFCADAAAAPLEGRIKRVGLFAGGDPVVRGGCWTIIEAELRWRGPAPFIGALRTRQTDRDGDAVVFEAPIALEPNADWMSFQLYFIPSDAGRNVQIEVRVLDGSGSQMSIGDGAGEASDFLRAEPPTFLDTDEFLVIDLTSPVPLPHLTVLDKFRRGQHGFVNARCVRAMPPRDLPAHWHGLDGVDAIVWDDADPTSLAPAQIDALADWVTHGGRLLMTAGHNWRLLRQSPMARLLPARIDGTEERTEAQEFLDIVDNARYAGQLDRHYARNPFLRCTLTALPDSQPLPSECPNPQICHRNIVGGGMVTFLGASLKDLIPVPPRVERLARQDDQALTGNEDDSFVGIGCERLLARRLLALPPPLELDQKQGFMPFTALDLFDVIRGSMSFESVGAKYLIFAILFAASYTFIATAGSYVYLRKRGRLQHCWSLFAVVSLAGGVVGTGMVGVLRGITTSLWQTTIVDARAGSDSARAAAFYGIKTPRHARLDLSLPLWDETGAAELKRGPIRPMPRSESDLAADARFAAAAEYEAARNGLELVAVPFRATLKEFTGNWTGDLPGRLDGRLVLRRPRQPDNPLRYEFAPGSFLRNSLGVDLTGCYLLVTSEETAGERATTLANCFALGDLPARGSGSELSDVELRIRLLHNPQEGVPPGDESTRITSLPLLSAQIDAWKGQLRSLVPALGRGDREPVFAGSSNEYPAILLLGVFDLARPDEEGRTLIRRGPGRRLGCAHLLTRRTAVLIGASREAPPAILHVDGEPLVPSRSSTVYRFVIPVDRI